MTKVLKLALLGPIDVRQGDVALSELVSAKAHALLYYLAVTARPHSRQALAGLLWGDLPEADARRNLRGVVMKLRQIVGDHLVITHQEVAFNQASLFQLDVAEFRQLLLPAQGQPLTLAQLRAAIALYRGDFLADFQVRQAPAFEEWVMQQQAQLREMVFTAYHSVILMCREQGLFDVGVAYARQLLLLDPIREDVHRQLMWLLARQGQRSAALAQYEVCRDILARELSLEPAAETAVLYEQIRAGDMIRPEAPRPTPPAPKAQPFGSKPTPFVAGPPITRPIQFFGRERELKRLFNLLKRLPLQNAAIIGPRRSGKTSLLHYLRSITTTHPAQLRPTQRVDWLSGPEHYRWVFVDFQDPRLGSRQALLQHLLTHMALPLPDVCDLDQFLDIVSEHLTQPTVILFDEIGVALERYPELDDMFWESLRSLATNQVGGNLAFILAAPEAPSTLATHQGLGSPFFNIFGYTAPLGPLHEEEARELITSSPIPFPDADVRWILDESACWPLLLQILCRERLLTLEEGDHSDAWRVDALQQIAPFLELKTYAG
ncbi:MAG: hypothetical protein H6660_04570 [Ardenticatenaceae bacterium]|nr:hypothetical protein [Ardenticatenaceae bacterium]